MTEYEFQLKREETEVIEIKVNGNRFMLDDSADLFDAPNTCSIITSIISMMEKEGLEWLKVEASP